MICQSQHRLGFTRATVIACAAALSAGTALGVDWTGGGATPSWGDADNFSSSPALPGGGDDVEFGTGFASGTNTTLDGNRTISTLIFGAGSNAVNLNIGPGTGGELTLNDRDPTIVMDSSSTHEISALVNLPGSNTGQEHRIQGSGGGTLIFSGGIDSNAKSFLELGGSTVVHLTGTATGPGRTDVNSGSILRAAMKSNVFGGRLQLLGGGGSGGPTNQGGILEITSAAHDFNDKDIRVRGGGFAAVGEDVTLSLTNHNNGGDTLPGNDNGGVRFGSPNATHTLTLTNDILRGNQASYITTIDGPVLLEAILTGELARGDRLEFRGDGAVMVTGKLSSRDPIEIQGGAVILGDTLETANQDGNVQNRTFELNDKNNNFGTDADAALLLSGAQSRGGAVQINATANGSANVGGWDGVNAFLGTVDTNGNATNLYARTAGTTTTFIGNIGDSGDVTVNNGFNSIAGGEGTVVYDGDKTYTGSTDVNGGTLQIAASVTSLGTSGIDVNNGGTLDNRGDLSGTIVTVESSGLAMGDGTYGSLNVNAGGAVNAGTSPGTMVASMLDIAGDGIIEVELDTLAGPGTGWDFYDVDTFISPGGGGNLFVDMLVGDLLLLENDFSIKFLQFDNEVQPGDALATMYSVRNDLGDPFDGASVRVDGNMLFIDFVAPTDEEGAPVVPEPMTALLSVLGLGGMALRRRR